MENLPRHIAVIMDGNGRWAKAKKHERIFGHNKGADAVRILITECAKKGIEALSLYAFSTENWKRPKYEINFLFNLLDKFLVSERELILKNNIRFRCIGQVQRLPQNVQEKIAKLSAESLHNTGMTLNLALSYGGRDDIIEACKSLYKTLDSADSNLNLDERIDSIDEQLFSRYLSTGDLPDPELLIRTSGESRISNFLLWQCAYAELYFTPGFLA